ncbi:MULTISPECIES: DUF3306 domain-containing protein [unclassified Roseovarius]|uniref:DUF3306 domain-containing protein n=1 Tax=unclassified Roseovarius TaxID=2614913 RepID=UPI00273FD8D5|nr:MULTISPECIES: DUF3306 domain-containing protein [unclassified Roseovarius]
MSEARDFWSRRKARVAEEAEAEEVALQTRAIEAEQAEKTDDEILADLGLPDPDSLDAGDDFSGFMARAVPDRIRSRALRKLWLTNPVLANVDGLVDYGEDFTDAACVIENLSTTYQVGKGMQAHLDEMARQAELESAEEEEGDVTADPSDEDIAEDDQLAEELATEPEPDEVIQPAEAIDMADAEPMPAPRRRMRFSFQDEEVADA